MKRDIDLARQLLFDIEARGADCSVSVLRTTTDQAAEERVRYHLRLLVDAGYLKEIDRTAGGVPCLRLTDAGHELVELVRSDVHWRHAKWICHERTGGLSLTVIRTLVTQWATAPRPRRAWRRYRPAPVGPLEYQDAYGPYAEAEHFDGELPDGEYSGYEPGYEAYPAPPCAGITRSSPMCVTCASGRNTATAGVLRQVARIGPRTTSMTDRLRRRFRKG